MMNQFFQQMLLTRLKAGWWSAVFWLTLVLVLPNSAQAQWPPFKFKVTPVRDANRVTYQLEFSPRVEGVMTDIAIKIQPPAGTRFLDAGAPASTRVTFDGREITFFTSYTYKSINSMYFVVELTDPQVASLRTQAWIAWEGNLPGEFLTEPEIIDLTRQPLNWTAPQRSRLQLDAAATVVGEEITYTIYPKNLSSRMWDLRINVPLPAGTKLLSIDALPPFTSNFDGREVSFSILELPAQIEVAPLSFKVSSQKSSASLLTTLAWATWKNSGPSVGRTTILQEDTRTGDLMVQPGVNQQVVADPIGDAFLASYDVTSVALQPQTQALKIILYTAGDLGPADQALEYFLYLDTDCRADTGQVRDGRGADYRIRYRYNKGQADLSRWETTITAEPTDGPEAETDEVEETWQKLDSLQASGPEKDRFITVWLPYKLLNYDPVLDTPWPFCWLSESRLNTKIYDPKPPQDRLPDSDNLRLTRFEITPATLNLVDRPLVSTNQTMDSAASTMLSDQPDRSLASLTLVEPESPVIPATHSVPLTLEGKLAVPLDNSQGAYDTHLFNLPGGQELLTIPFARQPNFSSDGQRLLLNLEGGDHQNIYEYNLSDQTLTQVSDSPEDSHPFYDPWGNRVVYGNAKSLIGAPTEVVDQLKARHYTSQRNPFLFVQCSLLPPHQEVDPRCHKLTELGVLVPAAHMGDLQGTHPIWAANDLIVYRGCDTWRGSTACGLYAVPATSTKGFSDGFIPRQLTDHPDDVPTDAEGNLIALMSRRDGNWEVYTLGLDGSLLQNLSNAPESNDGLPTISPDRQWIAFVSDRGGRWAIWTVPSAGGSAQKLFDLPGVAPWGENERAWSNERISWGP
jgi:hypothetical protein